jgi:hypothetical protein
MHTANTNFDVTPKGIAARIMRRKIGAMMDELVNNNITFYTHVDGSYNSTYYRTRAVLEKALLD